MVRLPLSSYTRPVLQPNQPYPPARPCPVKGDRTRWRQCRVKLILGFILSYQLLGYSLKSLPVFQCQREGVRFGRGLDGGYRSRAIRMPRDGPGTHKCGLIRDLARRPFPYRGSGDSTVNKYQVDLTFCACTAWSSNSAELHNACWPGTKQSCLRGANQQTLVTHACNQWPCGRSPAKGSKLNLVAVVWEKKSRLKCIGRESVLDDAGLSGLLEG